jgi:glycosyltransferase involved in cell wall biosynthesis
MLEHDIIVYVDSDNDGATKWLDAVGIKYLKNETDNPMGIAYAYNRCIEAAATDVVYMFHADMVFSVKNDANLLKHLKPKTIVAATRIEPPLHPAGKEKIVEHFGMYPEDFKKNEFTTYVQNLTIKNKDVTTRGIFAPWIAYKSDLLEIGMHDESLHSYYEDSDIFQRLILNGCKMVQSWDALVYHFTCRGGQFAEGVEKPITDQKFIDMRNTSAQRFMRKWGSWIKNDEYQHPILTPKFDVGFHVAGLDNEDFKKFLLMFGSVYPETTHPTHDVSILFSQKAFLEGDAKNNIHFVENINAIIADSVEPNSDMEYGIFKLKSREVKDTSPSLIKI